MARAFARVGGLFGAKACQHYIGVYTIPRQNTARLQRRALPQRLEQLGLFEGIKVRVEIMTFLISTVGPKTNPLKIRNRLAIQEGAALH